MNKVDLALALAGIGALGEFHAPMWLAGGILIWLLVRSADKD